MENTDVNEFDFDSTKNEVYTKIPCAKAINKNFCGERKNAGIWVADECLLAAGWKTKCTDECKDMCTDHFVNTKPHSIIIKGGEEIKGRGLINCRTFCIRKTDLLKIGENGKFHGVWRKGDGDLKDSKGNKLYTCCRKGIYMFSDRNNNFLHKTPIQLTSKGHFQITQEKQLIESRKKMVKLFSALKKRQVLEMNELWHAHNGVDFIYECQLVGGNAQAEACICTGFQPITVDNMAQYTVGYDKEKSKFITDIYKSYDKWALRFSAMADTSNKDFFKQNDEY